MNRDSLYFASLLLIGALLGLFAGLGIIFNGHGFRGIAPILLYLVFLLWEH